MGPRPQLRVCMKGQLNFLLYSTLLTKLTKRPKILNNRDTNPAITGFTCILWFALLKGLKYASMAFRCFIS